MSLAIAVTVPAIALRAGIAAPIAPRPSLAPPLMPKMSELKALSPGTLAAPPVTTGGVAPSGIWPAAPPVATYSFALVLVWIADVRSLEAPTFSRSACASASIAVVKCRKPLALRSRSVGSSGRCLVSSYPVAGGCRLAVCNQAPFRQNLKILESRVRNRKQSW